MKHFLHLKKRENVSYLQAQLNALVPQFFPLHQHQFSAVLEAQGLKIVPGDNLLKIHLRPKRDDPLDYSKQSPSVRPVRQLMQARSACPIFYKEKGDVHTRHSKRVCPKTEGGERRRMASTQSSDMMTVGITQALQCQVVGYERHVMAAGDTRPVSDASAVQSRLREAHPKVFEALDLPEGKRDSLHINIPSCIQAVRIIGPITSISCTADRTHWLATTPLPCVKVTFL